jgi:hypothetical protein
MRKAAVLIVSGLLALSAAGAGQPLSVEAVRSASGVAVKAGAGCTGGIRFDDGKFEYGFGFGTLTTQGRLATAFLLPAAVNRIDAVCLCLARLEGSTPDFNSVVEVWSATGPGDGAPSTLLGSFPASFSGVPLLEEPDTFFRVDLPQGFTVPAGRVFIGLRWAPRSEASGLMVCADDSGFLESRGYYQEDGGPWTVLSRDLPPALLGIRAEVSDVSPPDGPWLTTPALPRFRFKVRITSGAQQIAGVQETDCVPETLCVSGAARGRSEVFVRIIGPRPNGFLWPSIVKFTTSQVEVWIEQTATGRLRYYKLPAQGPADTSLPGLVDREGFQP